MYVKLHLDPEMDGLVNRGKSSKLGLKRTQDPLKYATCPEAELRPERKQQSGGRLTHEEQRWSRKDQTVSTADTGFSNEI